MTTVYLVLKHRPNPEPVEIQGIFSTEAAARAACRAPGDVFIPLTLDHEYPQETTNNLVSYCPAQNLVWLPGATDWTPDHQSI